MSAASALAQHLLTWALPAECGEVPPDLRQAIACDLDRLIEEDPVGRALRGLALTPDQVRAIDWALCGFGPGTELLEPLVAGGAA